MEAVDEQTENELPSLLSSLLAPDGSWNPSAVQSLGPETWAEWFRTRLDGCDPHFGYDREDHATHPANLFRALFDDLGSLNTANAAQRLAWYLDSLDPSEANGTALREAIDLVLHVRPRSTPARDDLRETLRDWIGEPGESALLDRPEGRVAPATLLRKALFALAALQFPGGRDPNGERNDDRHIETFRAWIDHPDVAEAAFSGLGLALPSTPDAGVVHNFLLLCEDEGIQPKYPLETLFIDRPSRHQQIRTYLWSEVQRSGDSEKRWEQLRTWLNDEFYLPSYRLMETRREQYTDPTDTDQQTSASSEAQGPPWTENYDTVR